MITLLAAIYEHSKLAQISTYLWYVHLASDTWMGLVRLSINPNIPVFVGSLIPWVITWYFMQVREGYVAPTNQKPRPSTPRMSCARQEVLKGTSMAMVHDDTRGDMLLSDVSHNGYYRKSYSCPVVGLGRPWGLKGTCSISRTSIGMKAEVGGLRPRRISGNPSLMELGSSKVEAEAIVSSTTTGRMVEVVGDDWASQKARYEWEPRGLWKLWLEREGGHFGLVLLSGASPLLCCSWTTALVQHRAVAWCCWCLLERHILF